MLNAGLIIIYYFLFVCFCKNVSTVICCLLQNSHVGVFEVNSLNTLKVLLFVVLVAFFTFCK